MYNRVPAFRELLIFRYLIIGRVKIVNDYALSPVILKLDLAPGELGVY